MNPIRAVIVVLVALLLASAAWSTPSYAQAPEGGSQAECERYGCIFEHCEPPPEHYGRATEPTEPEPCPLGIAHDRLPDGPDNRRFVGVQWPIVRGDYRFNPNRYQAWMPLAHCESGNNPRINTGNGYHGLIQFHPQTWRAYGGQQFAAYAYQATAIEQLTVGERVLWAGWGQYGPQGPNAWPGCRTQGRGAPAPAR